MNKYILYNPSHYDEEKRIVGPFYQSEVKIAINRLYKDQFKDSVQIFDEDIFKTYLYDEYCGAFRSYPFDFLYTFFMERISWLETNVVCNREDLSIVGAWFKLHYDEKDQVFTLHYILDVDPWLRSRLFYELCQYIEFVDMDIVEDEEFWLSPTTGDIYYGEDAALQKLLDNVSAN